MMKPLLLPFALLAACVARAEYLNVFIDPDDSALSAYEFEGVRLGWYETDAASDGATVDALVDQGGIVGFSSELYPTDEGPALISYDISSLGASYSYFVEFINYDTAVRHVAYSTARTYAQFDAQGAISYADMASKGYASSSLSTLASLSPVLNGVTISGSVPEPTGAALVAVGLAALGLRRKRA